MGLGDILEAAEESIKLDQRRREAFEEELDAYEANDLERFDRTRDAIDAQRESITNLRELLQTEEEEIETLVEESAFLSVDQATRHRKAAVEKLTEHNRLLREYVDAMSSALDTIERNLDALERQGPEAVEGDPEPDLQRARDALEEHNNTVEGIGKNLRILNAYLV